MIVVIFLLCGLCTLFAWVGYRKPAFISFGLSLLLGGIWFAHHITSALNINL
ncbi:MAG: DUF5993 family protein [Gammaproteobacteria bacterium]